MCNYPDDNTLHAYNRFPPSSRIFGKRLYEILENCFYDGCMVLNLRKCEFMNFEKTNVKEVTYKNCLDPYNKFIQEC